MAFFFEDQDPYYVPKGTRVNDSTLGLYETIGAPVLNMVAPPPPVFEPIRPPVDIPPPPAAFEFVNPPAEYAGPDPDGDGMDNTTGLAVGVVPDPSSPTGYSYNGIPVYWDGAPYEPVADIMQGFGEIPSEVLQDPSVVEGIQSNPYLNPAAWEFSSGLAEVAQEFTPQVWMDTEPYGGRSFLSQHGYMALDGKPVYMPRENSITDVYGRALSGLTSSLLPEEATSFLPPVVEEAVEGATSPLGLLGIGAGGLTGGISGLLRGAASEIGANLGYEVAAQGAEAVGIDNPYLQTGLGLAGGVLGGVGGFQATADEGLVSGLLRGSREIEDTGFGRMLADETGGGVIPGLEGVQNTASRVPIFGQGLKPRAEEVGERTGVLLKPRGVEQLGGFADDGTPNYKIGDALDVARDLERQSSSMANVIHAWGEEQVPRLGRIDKDGHTLLDVPPSALEIQHGRAYPSFYDVVENPDNYDLTPSQREAVEALAEPFRQLREERVLRGVPPNEVEIAESGGFFHRKALENREGRFRSMGASKKLGGGKDRSRQFETAAEALANDVRYASILDSLDEGINRGLKLARDAHVSELLKPFGQTFKDRMPPELEQAYKAKARELLNARKRLLTAEKQAGINTTLRDELDEVLERFVEATPTNSGSLARLPAVGRSLRGEAESLTRETLQRPPGSEPVRIKMPVEDTAKAEARGIERALEAFEELIPDDVERIRALDTALLRTARRAAEIERRAGSAWLKEADLGDTLSRLESDFMDLRSKYQSAAERARQIPRGRASIPQEMAPALIGRDFDEKAAQKIIDFYGGNSQPARSARGSIANVVKKSRAVNTALIPFRATLDLSALLNQQGRTFVSNPGIWAKNVALAFRDVFTDTHYNRWLSDPKRVEQAKKGLVFFGDAGDRNEFQFNKFLTAGRWNPLNMTNKHYVRFNNRMRSDVMEAIEDVNRRLGRNLDARAQEEIAKGVNRLTGVSISRATDAEGLLEFAPNFLRSHIENLGKAVADRSIEGQIARKYLATYFSAGFGLVTAAALAQNRNPAEVLNPIDLDALERGELRLNPNFGTVRVLDQDVQVFGPYTGLARLVVAAGDAMAAGLRERDATQLLGFITDFERTKGSPLGQLAADLVKGETFTGEKPLSLVDLPQRFGPITVGNILSNTRRGMSLRDAVLDGVLNAIGGQSNPTTPFEDYTETLKQAYAEFDPREEGLRYTKPKDPMDDPLFKRIFARDNPDALPPATSEIGREIDRIQAEYRGEFEELNKWLVEGRTPGGEPFGVADWRARWSEAARAQRDRLAPLMEQFVEGDPKPGTPAYWVQSYFDTFEQSEVNGVLDPAKLDEAQAAWIEENGERAWDYINTFNLIDDTGVRLEYLQDMQKLAKGGYFNRDGTAPGPSLPHYRNLQSGLTESKLEELEAHVGDIRAERKWQDEPWLDTAVVILQEEGYSKEEIGDVLKAHLAQTALTALNEGRDHQGLAWLNPDYFKFRRQHQKELKWLDFDATYEDIEKLR